MGADPINCTNSDSFYTEFSWNFIVPIFPGTQNSPEGISRFPEIADALD